MENLERRKLLKCSYEKTFHVKDKAISKLFSTEEIRNDLRDKIAEKAKLASESLVIDVPTVPSVPYHHSVLLEPMEILVFSRTKKGKKVAQRLSDISRTFEALKGFLNIVRVYTDEKHRDKVAEASSKVLGELPYSATISY